MKKLMLIVACMFCLAGYGQFFSVQNNRTLDLDKYDVLDTVQLKFTYKMSYVWDVKHQDRRGTDMQILEIGSRISKYYSRYLAVDYPKFLKKFPMKDVAPSNPERGTQPYEIYKDYPAKGTQTVTDISDFTGKRLLFLYEETIPKLDWELYDEFVFILDYRCQKATTSFRGRDYVAWFTAEIPVNNGPWKFGGLPGLILKTTDSENHYDFECIGMEQPKEEVIKFYEGKFDKINRKDYLKSYQRMHNDIVGFSESMGIGVMMMSTDGPGGHDLVKGEFPPQPYNPIERE